MQHLKKVIILVLLLLSLNAKAGVTALTFHSRANCLGFNESISWHLGTNYKMLTYSEHYKNWLDTSPTHVLNSGVEVTWRSAAYHATEGYGGWGVVGYHYMYPNNVQTLYKTTPVKDCSIYDGWWDH